MNALPEIKITLALSAEFSGLLQAFLDYLNAAQASQVQPPKLAGKRPKGEPSVPVPSQQVTIEMLRSKIAQLIRENRDKRALIEAKLAEMDASNPTMLKNTYYIPFWDFLSTL